MRVKFERQGFQLALPHLGLPIKARPRVCTIGVLTGKYVQLPGQFFVAQRKEKSLPHWLLADSLARTVLKANT